MKIIVSDPSKNFDQKDIAEGVIVIKGKNRDQGSIMFVEKKETSGMVLGQNYSASSKARTFFQNETLENLTKYVQENNLKVGSEISGYKIIIQESFEPAYPTQKTKKGETVVGSGVFDREMTSGGRVVYRNTLLVPESSPEKDILLPNDTRKDIQNAEIADLVSESNQIS